MSGFASEQASFSERMLMRDPNTATSRVFVGSIPHEDVSKKDMEHCFSRFGKVTGCLLNKGFGFIQFEDERSATEAINASDIVLNGRRLDVKQARVFAHKAPPARETRDDFPDRDRDMFRDDRDRDRERERERDRDRHERERDMFRDERDRDPFRDRSPSLERGRDRRERDERDWRPRERERFDSYSKPPLERDRFFDRDGRDRYPPRDMDFRDRPSAPTYGEDALRSQRVPAPYRSASIPEPRGPPLPLHNPNVDRTNDCEIIVVNKKQTAYAEFIESRLRKLSLTVDILYPNEDVQMSRVLANIGSRGSLYAILIEPTNEEHKSLTLNILHGIPQVHLNMPLDDAFCLIAHNFDAYVRGEMLSRNRPNAIPVVPAVSSAAALALKERHPEAIQVLLTLLVENRTLTVLQYDKVISYLQIRREHQVQIEIGDAKDLAIKAESMAASVARSITTMATPAPALVTTAAVKPALNKTQIDLQHRILNILNSNATSNASTTASANSLLAAAPAAKPVQLPDAFLSPTKSGANAAPPVSSVPTGVPAPSQNWNPVSTASTTSSAVSPSPLLNDPTIQKALDELMQGNLLRRISTSSASTTMSASSVLGSAPSQPLFGAYANLTGNRRF